MDDEFEFPVPDELLPWIRAQREKELELSTPRYYILRDYKLVVASLLEWAVWFEDADNRRIERTVVGDSYVSTVFLGLDHNFCFDDLINHRPILFESMVFGGPLDQFQWRYSTLGESKRGHYELAEAMREDREPEMPCGKEGFWNLFRDMFE